MTETRRVAAWKQLAKLGDLEVSARGAALIAIGKDHCEPCEIIAEQIATFITKYDDVEARLYKFTTTGRPPADVQLLGEELRFFPTVLGFVDGELAFRMEGVLADAKPSDVTRLEKAFARFVARQT